MCTGVLVPSFTKALCNVRAYESLTLKKAIMNERRLIVALIAAFCATMPLLSNPKQKSDIRYAYGSTIDMQGGLAMLPYTVHGDAANVIGAAVGGEYMMRYSYFIGKHFGISATYSFDSMQQSDVRYFGVVNLADGGMYKYQSQNAEVLDVMNNSFIVSAVYRYDFGRWSLRPRLGIGFSNMSFSPYSYYRYDKRDLSQCPQYHEYTLSLRKYDYIAGTNTQPDNVTLFAAMAGVQITYSVADHFFFSAEVGLKMVSTSKFYYSHNIYDTKSDYQPQNWAQAIYQYDNIGNFSPDKESARILQSALPPMAVLSINIGIGWNIGINRNKTGKYHK